MDSIFRFVWLNKRVCSDTTYVYLEVCEIQSREYKYCVPGTVLARSVAVSTAGQSAPVLYRVQLIVPSLPVPVTV